MRILIVSALYPPKQTIGAHRPQSWAKYWSNFGEDVSVVGMEFPVGDSLMPLSSGRANVQLVRPGPMYNLIYKAYHSGSGDHSGEPVSNTSTVVQIKRIILAPFKFLLSFLKQRGLGTSIRWPEPMDFWVSPAKQKIQELVKERGPFDVVVSTFSPYCNHHLGHWCKSNGYARNWVADYRDLWSINPIFKGIPFFSWIERAVEKKWLRSADAVSVTCEGMKSHLSRFLNRKGIWVIPNAFDPEDAKGIEDRHFYPESETVKLAYVGSLYPGRRDPEPLFKALESWNEAKKFSVNFAGVSEEQIQAWQKKYGPSVAINSFGKLKRSDALRMQRDSDVLLFLESEKVDEEGYIPAKLYEYLYFKGKILGVGLNEKTEIGRTLAGAQRGECVGSDSDRIRNFLKHQLAQSPHPSISLGGDAFSEVFTREYQAREFLNLIKNRF